MIIVSVNSQKNNIQLVSYSLYVIVEIVEHMQYIDHAFFTSAVSICSFNMLETAGYQESTLRVWDEILMHL